MSGAPRRGPAAEALHFLRANLASGAATAVDWSVVTGLIWAGAHYLGAAASGAVAGAVTDFSLKRHWAFGREAKGPAHAEGLRYLAVAAASLGWNLAGSWLLVSVLGLPPVAGVIAASVAVGFAWNYPLHRLWVFPHAPGAGGPAGGAR